MQQKKVFKTILALFALLLIALPFLVSFNDVLTKLMEKIGFYNLIQAQIVPYEVGIVKILVSPFSISFTAFANGMIIRGTFLEMTWNCIGWQSLLLLMITLIVGLTSERYTFWSKTETVLIGILGTFIMNLFRLTLIVLIWAYARP